MLQRTRGIVLHTFKIKDNQLIAVVYTQQWGRMSYITTIPKSHKAGGKHLLLQPLAEVELEADMKPRTSLYRIKSLLPVQPLVSIPYHPVKSSIALFLQEFLYHAIREEGQSSEAFYAYLSHSVHWLDLSENNFANFHLVFLLRVSRFLGLLPNIDNYRPGCWFDMLNEKLPDETVKAIKDMELQTVRFVVDNTVNAPDENVLLNKEYIYGPKDNYVANVDSLTNFINWATKACPAKHYILIVSDHGGGYQPHDDLPFNAPSQTRGVLYDQSHTPNEHFTASSLKYAIGRANAHMDVIYLDACLMNTIEYQFELKELANYFILSSFTVPGAGGSYSVLIDELAKNTGDIETALKNFNKCLTYREWWKAFKTDSAFKKVKQTPICTKVGAFDLEAKVFN